MAGTHTLKGTIAKALIALAVLTPAFLILGVALRSRMLITGLRITSLTPWMIADACVLGLGLMLHRGEVL